MTDTNRYEILHMTPNGDGTYTRSTKFFTTTPASTTDPTSPSLSKDVPLKHDKSTSVRLYLPRESYDQSSYNKKLPIAVYVHGGGFVLASTSHPSFNDFSSYAASQLGALVVSVDYRLTPEHRLPAAYEDVLEALTWLKDEKDEWVKEYGDLSRCVMLGDSAGANIVYNSGLMVAGRVDEFKPLSIKGLLLIQPFFSGLDRTESEMRLVNDPILPLVANDLCWELSLPDGADRSHEYCDPLKGGGSSLLDRVKELGWWIWVASCDGDPLFGRSLELVKLMEKRGMSVKTMFIEGGQHGIFVGNPSEFKSKELVNFLMGLFS